ncbi:heat shock protein transcriptional repressor HspR [Glycomyces arizonensis]|uniref:heat shock protein transcriptional repressor HspR n=1 Tax=Glycomyces arizonensis TaxID=256035 RepID=UPI00041582C7|nr:helix-turn-helix transcriptional regulator [Glycomyces arizonensis]
MTASENAGSGDRRPAGRDERRETRMRTVVDVTFLQRGAAADDADFDFDAKIFAISAAAELAGMHPQTLRQYDRLGLVEPARTPGGGRRYSARDVAQLREIQRLSQDEGVNLAGVKRIMDLEREVAAMRAELAAVVEELRASRAQLAELRAMAGPFQRRGTDIVLWQGKRQ